MATRRWGLDPSHSETPRLLGFILLFGLNYLISNKYYLLLTLISVSKVG